MPNVQLKVGEIEAILDLLLAIEKKGQWVTKLQKNNSPHATYFPDGISKTIRMMSKGLPYKIELFDKKSNK